MKIVFMLEEPSAKSMLQVIVPKIIPEYIQVQYVSFDGKTNLEKESAPQFSFVVISMQFSPSCESTS